MPKNALRPRLLRNANVRDTEFRVSATFLLARYDTGSIAVIQVTTTEYTLIDGTAIATGSRMVRLSETHKYGGESDDSDG